MDWGFHLGLGVSECKVRGDGLGSFPPAFRHQDALSSGTYLKSFNLDLSGSVG